MNKRRHYDEAFKIGAVKLVTEQGYTIAQAADRLGLGRKSLHDWIGKFAPGFGQDQAVEQTCDDPIILKQELTQLRKENDRLRLERDILKKATAYFAKDVL